MAAAGESNLSTIVASSGSGGSGSDFPTGDAIGTNTDQAPLAQVKPSGQPKGELLRILKNWFRADASHSSIWRGEAKEDFDFRAGEQWTPEDRATLNAQQRPHIVFNRVLTILKAVAGMEINGRHEINFLPVNSTETALNEVLSSASKWMGEGCDAEDEESQAFDNCGTCGMGWTESRLDFEENPKGKYIEESIDPLEMYWDRTAKKKNLSDARRMARLRKMPLGDAMELFPGYTKEQLDASWANGQEIEHARKTLEEKRRREENTTDSTYDDMYEVTIVHIQWWERETYYLVADPQTNTKSELTEQQWRSFETRMRMLKMEPIGVKMTRRVYQQAFLGNEVLKAEKAPVQTRFIWACITGELNRTKGTFFGLARIMRDPQMWANKWLSQVLHILNTTAKGGIVAEKNAFEDERLAEDTWARPDAITWVAEKALSGDKPKIMPKPGSFSPAGHLELMQFAITAIRDVTGINLELIGLKDINQPGILEAMRKQAGMTVLATLFDSLRRFRKQVGRIRLYFIQTFFSDGRLVRVVGPESASAVPLLKDKCIGEYDVIVDDTPTSPNQKEANWAIIQPFLAVFKDILIQKPQLLATILEYSPLPSRLVEAIKSVMAQSAQQPPTPQEQLQIQSMVADIALKHGKAAEATAGAKKDGASAMWDVAAATDMLHKSRAEIPNMIADTAATHAEAAHTRAKTENTVADTAHKKAQTVHQHVQAGAAALTPIPHEPPPVPAIPGQDVGAV